MNWKSVFAGALLGFFGGALMTRAGLPPALTGIVLMSIAAAIGLSLLQLALFGSKVERARESAERLPLRSTLLGLLTVLSWVFMAQAARGGPVAGPMALVLLLLAAWCLLGGLPATTALLVGQRLAPEAGAGGQVVTGVVVLALALMVPVLGWALALGVVMAGVGGEVLSHVAPA